MHFKLHFHLVMMFPGSGKEAHTIWRTVKCLLSEIFSFPFYRAEYVLWFLKPFTVFSDWCRSTLLWSISKGFRKHFSYSQLSHTHFCLLIPSRIPLYMSETNWKFRNIPEIWRLFCKLISVQHLIIVLSFLSHLLYFPHKFISLILSHTHEQSCKHLLYHFYQATIQIIKFSLVLQV